MSQIVEVDVVSVSSSDLGHGKTRVTIVIDTNTSDNVPSQITEGDKVGIELPSHHPPA